MFYNYWSYPRFLLNKIFKPTYYASHKWFASKYTVFSSSTELRIVKVPKNSLPVNKDQVIVYRVYWHDGTISPWLADKEGNTFKYLGSTHRGEVIILRYSNVKIKIE